MIQTMQKPLVVGLVLVLVLALVCLPTLASEEEGECVVGSDGEQVCRESDSSSSSPTMDLLSDQNCVDGHEKCAFWASAGECKNNPGYMLVNCQKSCGSCLVETEEQRKLADATEAYGERQSVTNELVAARIQEVLTYMTDTVFVNASYANVKDGCKNQNAQCAAWAVAGECEANPNYMTINCAPTCFSCEQLDFDLRCPFDRDAPKTFEKEGDVSRFFERLLDNSKDRYSPTLFSAPTAALEKRRSDPKITIPNTVIDDGPWVVTLQNFLSEAECERLIELGDKEGYERSKDVGGKRFDGTFDAKENPRRTSTNAWCSGNCYNDTITQEVTQRLEDLTGIPSNNSEYWQLLKYEEGQEYMEHHDWIQYQVDRAEGVRILTVFFYLNTVEQDGGGGTRFPKLDLTVQPVRGSALIWPSTLDDKPDDKDPRTNHQAMPVLKGIKYGANAWIHQRDYKTPHEKNCQ